MGENMATTDKPPVDDKCRVRVAIVDDDEDIVEVLGEVLRRAG